MADTPNASGEPGELYLDAAATESVSPAVIEAMTPFLTEAYANPASVHQPGKTAARALDAARASFAAALARFFIASACAASMTAYLSTNAQQHIFTASSSALSAALLRV